MLNLNVTKDGETLCVALEGRLDTVSSPELEECLRGKLQGDAADGERNRFAAGKTSGFGAEYIR